VLKHNNLMLRSEPRERLEAWATRHSPISHSGHQLFSSWPGPVKQVHLDTLDGRVPPDQGHILSLGT